MVKRIVKVATGIAKENMKVYTTIIRTGSNRFHHALGMKITFGVKMPSYFGNTNNGFAPLFWVHEDKDIFNTRHLSHAEEIVECIIPQGVEYRVVNYYTIAVDLLIFKEIVR